MARAESARATAKKALPSARPAIRPMASGNAGSDPGAHILEVEVSLDELAAILGDELELPRIEPKGKANIEQQKARYTSIRRSGPESLRHFKRTYMEALRRQISSSTYDRRTSAGRAHSRRQALPLLDRRRPARGQRRRDLHDGRLGLDDRRAEAHRPHGGLLARYLAEEPVRRASKPATSSTTRRPRKSTRTRSTTPAKAAARGSARPTRCAPS